MGGSCQLLLSLILSFIVVLLFLSPELKKWYAGVLFSPWSLLWFLRCVLLLLLLASGLVFKPTPVVQERFVFDDVHKRHSWCVKGSGLEKSALHTSFLDFLCKCMGAWGTKMKKNVGSVGNQNEKEGLNFWPSNLLQVCYAQNTSHKGP